MAFIQIKSADFAHIDQCAPDAVFPQQLDDFVGDIALCDAVERQAHAFFGKRNGPVVETDIIKPDQTQCFLNLALRRRGFRIRMAAEIAGIHVPQRLDSRIERAFGHLMDVAAQAQQGQHIGGRIVQTAFTVQLANQAVVPIETEYFFQTRHFCQHFADQQFGGFPVSMVQTQFRSRTQGNAFPNDWFSVFGRFGFTMSLLPSLPYKRQRGSARDKGGDGKETAAGQRSVHRFSVLNFQNAKIRPHDHKT